MVTLGRFWNPMSISNVVFFKKLFLVKFLWIKPRTLRFLKNPMNLNLSVKLIRLIWSGTWLFLLFQISLYLLYSKPRGGVLIRSPRSCRFRKLCWMCWLLRPWVGSYIRSYKNLFISSTKTIKSVINYPSSIPIKLRL